MVGMPIRRARKQFAELQRQTQIRGGVEPMPEHDLGYHAVVNGPPARHVPVPKEDRPKRPRQPRQPVPAIVPPPLTQEEAALFAEMRKIAQKKVFAFLAIDLATIKDEGLRIKTHMKQVEISQSVMALGGRIDPGTLRGQQNDELGEMLTALKADAS